MSGAERAHITIAISECRGARFTLMFWGDGADPASPKPDCIAWPYWQRESCGGVPETDCPPRPLRIIDNEFNGAGSAPAVAKLPRQFTCWRYADSSAGLQGLHHPAQAR